MVLPHPLKTVGDSTFWAFLVCLSSSPSDEQSGLFPGFSTTEHTTVNVLPCWARAHTYKLSNEQPNLVACCVEPSPTTK